jgi:hypothetical protein
MFGKKEPKSPTVNMDFVSQKHVRTWSVEEVCLWLHTFKLERYADLFHSNDIDGELLEDIDEDDLIAMPIDRLDHRKTMEVRQKLK